MENKKTILQATSKPIYDIRCEQRGDQKLDRFLSPKQAAHYLGVNVKLIYDRMARREIDFQPIGRLTYASHFVMSGGSLADLQSLLGHSSSEMTRKYAHLTPGHLESKSKVISFVANLESPGA